MLSPVRLKLNFIITEKDAVGMKVAVEGPDILSSSFSLKKNDFANDHCIFVPFAPSLRERRMHNIQLFVWCVTQINKQHDSIDLLSSVDATMRSNGATATADFRSKVPLQLSNQQDDVVVWLISLTCHGKRQLQKF